MRLSFFNAGGKFCALFRLYLRFFDKYATIQCTGRRERRCAHGKFYKAAYKAYICKAVKRDAFARNQRDDDCGELRNQSQIFLLSL